MKDKVMEKLDELKVWSKGRPEAKEVRLLISKAKAFIQSIRKQKDDNSNSANLSPQ